MIRTRTLSDQFAPPVRTVEVDNDGLVDEVVAHARVFADMIVGVPVFDGEATHAYLVEHVTYTPDDDLKAQLLRAPWRTASEGRADCKSYAIFIAALAKSAGDRVCLRFIDEVGVGAYTHVYAIVNGTPIDPLEPYGSEIPHVAARDVCI